MISVDRPHASSDPLQPHRHRPGGDRAAEESLRLNGDRIQNAQGLPIEVLQSIQSLALVRREYLNAVVDYNIAQFQLWWAAGWFSDPVASLPTDS